MSQRFGAGQSPETEEKIRKLAPVDPRKTHSSWLFYLSGEGEERQLAENLIEVPVFRKFPQYYRDRTFPEYPSAARLTRQKIHYIVIERKYSVHTRCKYHNMKETGYGFFLYG